MKELYLFDQAYKIRKLIFEIKNLDEFIKENSVYNLFCSNYKNKLEGYVFKSESLGIDGEEYFYVIVHADKDKKYVYNSELFELKYEAILTLKEMFRYFPLYGFNSKFLIKNQENLKS